MLTPSDAGQDLQFVNTSANISVCKVTTERSKGTNSHPVTPRRKVVNLKKVNTGRQLNNSKPLFQNEFIRSHIDSSSSKIGRNQIAFFSFSTAVMQKKDVANRRMSIQERTTFATKSVKPSRKAANAIVSEMIITHGKLQEKILPKQFKLKMENSKGHLYVPLRLIKQKQRSQPYTKETEASSLMGMMREISKRKKDKVIAVQQAIITSTTNSSSVMKSERTGCNTNG